MHAHTGWLHVSAIHNCRTLLLGKASLEPVPFGPHPPLNHIGWLHTHVSVPATAQLYSELLTTQWPIANLTWYDHTITTLNGPYCMVCMYWASENSIKGVPKSSKRGLFCPFQSLLESTSRQSSTVVNWPSLIWPNPICTHTNTPAPPNPNYFKLELWIHITTYTSHRQSLRSFISYSAFKKGYWACNDRPMAGGLSLCKAASILLVVQEDPDKVTWNIYWFHFTPNVHGVLVYA